MLTLSSITTEHIINAYLYLSFYNASLLILFWVILSVQNKELQTLYSFNRFRYSNFYIIVLTVTLFSIAGVPPFMGFFSKVLVITALVKSHYILLYWLLLPLLLLSLYFYVQNIRFLYTTTLPSIKYPYLLNERLPLLYVYSLLISLNYQIIGFVWFDKFLLFFHWLIL